MQAQAVFLSTQAEFDVRSCRQDEMEDETHVKCLLQKVSKYSLEVPSQEV